MNTLRGAGSQAGVMRTGVTLFEMSPKDATALKVTEAERHRYVRLDDAKTNLFLKTPGATWYRRESVSIGGLDGQNIGVLVPVRLIAAVKGRGLVDSLAEALNGMPSSQWHNAGLVIERLPGEHRKAFSDRANRARDVKALFSGGEEVMTDFGKMRILVRRTGTQLMLEAYSSLHYSHDEQPKSLNSLASSTGSSADEGGDDERS